MSGLRPNAREPARERLVLQGTRQRRTVTARQIAFRRFRVRTAKVGLPILALLLLSSVALWPEIARMGDQGRLSFRRIAAVEAQSGRMLNPRYRGVSEKGRPYTLTGTAATQAGQNRVDLDDPKGDVVLENGTWLQVESKKGVYLQHTEELDMSHDVVLYRDDGTVIRTQSAVVDVKQGAATSSDQTHAEGPFGVLDAQGFTLTDKGGVIQFEGPARLIMNGAQP